MTILSKKTFQCGGPCSAVITTTHYSSDHFDGWRVVKDYLWVRVITDGYIYVVYDKSRDIVQLRTMSMSQADKSAMRLVLKGGVCPKHGWTPGSHGRTIHTHA